MGNFLSEISLFGGFNLVQTSEGYMDLIGFVCVLESKGLSHALGSKGLCHQSINRKHPYKQGC